MIQNRRALFLVLCVCFLFFVFFPKSALYEKVKCWLFFCSAAYFKGPQCRAELAGDVPRPASLGTETLCPQSLTGKQRLGCRTAHFVPTGRLSVLSAGFHSLFWWRNLKQECSLWRLRAECCGERGIDRKVCNLADTTGEKSERSSRSPSRREEAVATDNFRCDKRKVLVKNRTKECMMK